MFEPGIITPTQHDSMRMKHYQLTTWFNMLIDAETDTRKNAVYERAIQCGFRKDFAYHLAYEMYV